MPVVIEGTKENLFSELLLHLFDFEGLDDVLLLDVAVALEADTALEALGDLLDVVLEALERVELAFPDDGVVAGEAGVARTDDLALDDVRAGDDDAADLEDGADFRLALALLDLRG